MIFNALMRGQDQVRTTLRRFWLSDYNINALNSASIQLVCDSNVDMIRNNIIDEFG